MTLKKFLSALTLALLVTIAPVAATAQESGQETSNNDQTVQTAALQEEDDDEKNSPANIKARLEERKAALKTRLDAAKQNRIKSRCKASQGSLSSISGRIKGLETSRTQVYANLLSRLNKLNDRLKEAGVSTTDLEMQITELTTLIETFNSELEEYKTAVSDLATMDCAADPTAFQASLEAARTARTETADAAKAVRAYLTDTIKPTLSELKAQAADKEETE